MTIRSIAGVPALRHAKIAAMAAIAILLSLNGARAAGELAREGEGTISPIVGQIRFQEPDPYSITNRSRAAVAPVRNSPLKSIVHTSFGERASTVGRPAG